jgi:antitoxin ParD1/3/4|tara:strand:+ start:988 stop:1278 length:291 start_codon:yes stop_codon:yes gene_type:complete
MVKIGLLTDQIIGVAMNVSLTNELESYVKSKVATGMYTSVSEVMREALRLMGERDTMKAATLAALKQDINEGMMSIERGEAKPLDIESIKSQGRAR